MPADSEFFLDGNLLLKALHKPDRALLTPHLERVDYARGDSIFAAGSDVAFITFPSGRMVATLVITMADGRSAETATIGREGAVGGIVSEGGLPASTHAVVQIAGSGLRIEAGRLQEAKRRSAALRNLFTRYADCLLAQVLQSAACNALHPIDQRCLRWLMTLQDRLGADVLPVTQELLASMLGVQRTYLTRILRLLQEQGLIEVGRGRITIRDRAAVESSACECHACVRRHFDSALGAVYGPNGRFEALVPPLDPGEARERRPAGRRAVAIEP